MTPQYFPFESEKNITLEDMSLDDSQKNLKTCLLDNYKHIFQDQPVLHKYFSYKFNVKCHEPYKIKPYPVPFSRRPAVQHEINKMLEWG